MVGILELRDLLFAKPDELISDLMQTSIVSVHTTDDREEATSAISKLDGVLPYTLASGNHDINWNFNYRVASGLPNYLKQSQVISKWGKIEAGVTNDKGEIVDEPSVANTAHEFNVNGVDYLIVTIEYAAHSTPGVMDWANNIIKNHPHHNVIITTHAYLSDNGEDRCRILVSVPKKLFKRAVKRNLLKRRIRESWRHLKHQVQSGTGMDILFMYSTKEILTYQEIYSHVEGIITKLNGTQKPAAKETENENEER